jgi:hypothetical protein
MRLALVGSPDPTCRTSCDPAGWSSGSSAASIVLSRHVWELHGCGKLCAARPARGLARRRGFRSGFSRLPADPTEPDDGQSWHPRRSDHHSSNVLPVPVVTAHAEVPFGAC